MARKIPVISCSIRHSPIIDPKFHQMEILIGVGMSSSLFFNNKNRGWGVLREFTIVLCRLIIGLCVLVRGKMGEGGLRCES